jgi:hypothetical protein
VRDGGGVPGVLFGAGLIAEDAECQDCGADGAVPGDDRVDDAAVSREVVGIESHSVHGIGAGMFEDGDLRAEVVWSAGGEHHGDSRSQPLRQLHPDLASTPEDNEQIAIGV